MWAKIVNFFKNSEVIFLARLQVFLGILLVVLASLDWSPLASSTMPSKQQIILYSILVVQGIVTEYARRRRATDLY